MLYFHYEQTLVGRKGIEYSDTTYGIARNVSINILRLVRLDGTAFDLYIENEYGDNSAERIVKANVELNGTEEGLKIVAAETGKIYVNIGSDGYKTYRWSGSNLVEISK